MDLNDKPLRMVLEIERDPDDPTRAILTLACGHKQLIDQFPFGRPPPCFRRVCEVEGCANA